MKSQIFLDTDVYPPFAGFPHKGMQFLRRLKKNNNRTWFKANKSEYEEFVRLPMLSFISQIGEPLTKIEPKIEVNPKRCIFRIYRDTRFSKDKTPYKTHVAAVFHLKGGHWEESAGFYVGIEPGSVDVGGGIYMPNSDQLKGIRAAILERAKEFLEIIENTKFRKRFGSIQGEKLRRTPQAFPTDHFMGEWLKHKQFYAGVEWKEESCHSRNFITKVVGVYRDLLPLVQFLNSAIGK